MEPLAAWSNDVECLDGIDRQHRAAGVKILPTFVRFVNYQDDASTMKNAENPP